jgi:hypothetical protein
MSCLPLDRRRPIGFDTEGSPITTVTTAEASAEDDRWVVAGADTHTDTIHVAAVDSVGRELGYREFPTTPTGYDAALTLGNRSWQLVSDHTRVLAKPGPGISVSSNCTTACSDPTGTVRCKVACYRGESPKATAQRFLALFGSASTVVGRRDRDEGGDGLLPRPISRDLNDPWPNATTGSSTTPLCRMVSWER